MITETRPSRKSKLKQLTVHVDRIDAHEDAVARLKGGGRWGSINPRTGLCGGIEMTDCGDISF